MDDNLLFIDDIFLDNKIEGCNLVNDIKESLKLREEFEKNSYLNKNESNFLKILDKKLKKKNFLLEFNDIVNLHINVKTNFFNIIAGKSGSGKTTLAIHYSDMLDATKENGRLNIIQMSQSYSTFDDLLFNLKDFIKKATDDLNNMYMVLIEDINYVQFEDVFSPLLDSYCEIKLKRNEVIKIPENLRIISTLTLRDGKISISKEFIDKVGFLILREADLKGILNIKRKSLKYETYKFGGYSEYKNYVKSSMNLSNFEEKEIEFFDKLNRVLKRSTIDAISFRTLDKINKMIINIPTDENDEYIILKGELIDRMICDKVIALINGEDMKLEKLLGRYSLDNYNIQDSEILDLISSDGLNEISNFRYTKEMIEKKSKELSLYGYTS